MSAPTIVETSFSELNLKARGKVRDIYDLGEHLLLVATDRVSAFDWILPDPIPLKGHVLTQLSLHWFSRLEPILRHHVVTADVDEMPAVLRPHREILRGRSILCRKATPFGAECVVRGYLTGSGWKDYLKSGTVCGLKLPAGLKKNARLDEPIFTPSTKAAVGIHDENITWDEFRGLVGEPWALSLRQMTLAAFDLVSKEAAQAGITLCDTKLEWGLVKGELILIDEAFTPDSSRYWKTSALASTAVGQDPPSFDKQVIRNWLETSGWDKASAPPHLPAEIIETASRRYLEIFECLTGRQLKV